LNIGLLHWIEAISIDDDDDDLDLDPLPHERGAAAVVCVRPERQSGTHITFCTLAEAEAAAAVQKCGSGCVGAHSVVHRAAGRVRVWSYRQPHRAENFGGPPLPNELSTAIVLPPPLVPVPPRATRSRRTRTKPASAAASTGALENQASEQATRCRYGHDIAVDQMDRCRACRRRRGREIRCKRKELK
jgi:hypothetical protein